MYSLVNIANCQKGQVSKVRSWERRTDTDFGKSVLIHSAAGGVGIACIQLAQYLEAEVNYLGPLNLIRTF